MTQGTKVDGDLDPPYTPEEVGLRVSVSIGRKIALPGYENVDIFFAVTGIEAGSTDAEIEEALVTGDRAFQLLKGRVAQKIKDVREGELA